MRHLRETYREEKLGDKVGCKCGDTQAREGGQQYPVLQKEHLGLGWKTFL